MMPRFASLLASGRVITLDGALATHLESLGVSTSSSLWSAHALSANPNAIRDVHEAYFRAGASIGISASYQASVPGFIRELGVNEAEALDLMKRSVVLAREAASLVVKERGGDEQQAYYVAGSVGPYAACLADGSEYTGSLPQGVGEKELAMFHRPRIQALLEAGADVLALETLPNAVEVQTLMKMLQHEFPNASAWLSLSIKDEMTLADGTPLGDIVRDADNCHSIVALGINCCSRRIVTRAISQLRPASAKPIIVYPNSGEVWDARARRWMGTKDEDAVFEALVREWFRLGASIVGGCCRSGPADVSIVSKVVAELNAVN